MTRHLDLPLPERCLEEPLQVREHLQTEPEMLLVLPPALALQFVEPCDEMLPPGIVLRLQAGIGVRLDPPVDVRLVYLEQLGLQNVEPLLQAFFPNRGLLPGTLFEQVAEDGLVEGTDGLGELDALE